MFIGHGLALPLAAVNGAGSRFALDATGEQIRAAIRDITRYGETLGPELVTNGDFSIWSAGAPVGWTTSVDGAGASMAEVAGQVRMISDGTGVEVAQAILTPGLVYKYSITISSITGILKLVVGGGVEPNFSAPGTYTGVVTAGSDGLLRVRRAAAVNAVFDNVSVKRYFGVGFQLPGTAGARINASARSSVAMERLADGTYAYAPHNLLTYSEDLSNAAWTKNAATATAGKLTETSAAGAPHRAYGSYTSNGAPATFWVEAKAAERSWVALRLDPGTDEYAYFDLTNGALGTVAAAYTAAITAVDSGYYRCEVRRSVVAAGSQNAVISLATGNGSAVYTGDGASGVLIRRSQVNIGPAATAYIPTTSAAVYAAATSYDSTNGWGLHGEAAATNRVLWSRDLSNAAWTKSSCSAALTATGVDGVANSASTVTASGANATVLQAITHASTERTLSIFLRRRTGTGTVETTINGGTTWVARTLTSSWERFTTTATLANPSVGIRIVTSGDAVDVDFVQPEDGAIATSPIATFGSTVTRAGDTPIISGVPSSTEYLLVADVVPLSVSGYPIDMQVDDGTQDMRVTFYQNGANPSGDVVNGGVASAQMASGATAVAGTPYRFAVGAKTNDAAVSVNGSAPVTDTSVTMPTGINRLRLSDGARAYLLRRIRLGTRKPSNAAIQGLAA